LVRQGTAILEALEEDPENLITAMDIVKKVYIGADMDGGVRRVDFQEKLNPKDCWCTHFYSVHIQKRYKSVREKL